MPGMIPGCYYKEDKEMTFEKKTWTNRIAEFINRRILTKEDGTTELVNVARSEGQISQEGDAFNAATMNDLEQRIADGFASHDEALEQVNASLRSKANASDLAAKASAADLNAEKNTRASVDASLQSQINDMKSVASFEFGTIISDVAEFSDGYLEKKDGVIYFSFEFKVQNITPGVTTNIASIPYKPYGICHCSATLYNGSTSYSVFAAVNDGIIQVHFPTDAALNSNKAQNSLRFNGSFPINQ